MENYAIYFWPKGTLASMPGSDTIFGAVCWGIQLLERADVGGMLADFQPPQFAFSSPCPVYRRGDKLLRFYPWPAWLYLGPDQVDHLARKAAHGKSTLNYKQALTQVSQKTKQFN